MDYEDRKFANAGKEDLKLADKVGWLTYGNRLCDSRLFEGHKELLRAGMS